LPSSSRALGFTTVAEAGSLTAKRLPRFLYKELMEGNGQQITLAANLSAFDEVGFVPRAAAGVEHPDLSTMILGQPIAFPVMVAPNGWTRLFHPDGDCAVVRASAAEGTVDLVSWDAGHSLEEVASAAPDGARFWQQVYWLQGREGALEVMDRAQVAGYEALVVTVDMASNPPNAEIPKLSLPVIRQMGPDAIVRPRWLVNFVRHKALQGLSEQKVTNGVPTDRLSPTWEDISWMRAHWRGPLVVKGILTVDDARRAVDVGADAIVVSNHGGKSLDTQPATLPVLPRIVEVVDGRVEVYLDGGIRRGTDVVKALALGARAVLIGRPYLFGLSLAGEAGVQRILQIFREEIGRTLDLLGCKSVQDLDGTYAQAPRLWTAN
jgi:isopentenyl diphosphate isomerase/L-lactate dehydrogenase-like FMN-dependent dehydrogenase